MMSHLPNDVHFAGFENTTLSGILETGTCYYLPEFEIKENKVGFRGYRFSTKVEKGKNKVIKKQIRKHEYRTPANGISRVSGMPNAHNSVVRGIYI